MPDDRTKSERREARRRNGRKMRVSGAGIRRVYKDAVVKRLETLQCDEKSGR